MNFNLMDLTAKQLTEINKYFIRPDKLNLSRDLVGGSFPDNISTAIANFIINHSISFTTNLVLIINDFSFHMTQALLAAGFRKENIVLLFCNFKTMIKDDNQSQDYISNIMSYHPIIKSNKLSIINTQGAKTMKFDYIIANPPYGKSGSFASKTTRAIMDNVEFDFLINLAPSSTYINNDKNLYKHIQYVGEKIIFGEDATTDPCIAILTKSEKSKYTSIQEFEISEIFESKLRKFYLGNISKPLVTLSHLYCKGAKTVGDKFSSDTSFITGIFVTNDGVHSLDLAPGEKIWNIEGTSNTPAETFISTRGSEQSITITEFSTPLEKTNFANWFYSAELTGKNPKSGLATKLLKGMNTTTSRPYLVVIPRVDWSHPWTDEEILKDYGYTEEEIKEILNDSK